MNNLNIGQVAHATGLSAKMIRYYEEIGLLRRIGRSPSGYRLYRDNDIHTLLFIRQARLLGFDMDVLRDLLSLWRDQTRSSRDVKQLAMKHIEELDQRIADLKRMRDTIHHLATHCQGNDFPECPILEGIAGAIQ